MTHFELSYVLALLFSGVVGKGPPHIIFILVDDLGWNDVSFHGSLQIPTPNIDTLAKDGLILNNYYTQPLCTPSRGSLMTGKYPLRLGLQHDVIHIGEPWGLSPKHKILPQYLKELGYATHAVGKWHLGHFHRNYLPTHRGFDSFFGSYGGNGDHFTHRLEWNGTKGLDLHEDDHVMWHHNNQYFAEIVTDKAKQIIHNHNASKPLFLFVSHKLVHTGNSDNPMQAPMIYVHRFQHIEDKQRMFFAGMVSALDDSIGELFEALNKSGILDNSLVVFTTDNGAAVYGLDQSTGSNWPLRGSKYNLWEGGIRGTAFLWSPNIRQKQTRIFSHLMHISDWLPTLYSFAGGEVRDLPTMDGVDHRLAMCCDGAVGRSVAVLNIDPEWKVEGIRKNNYKLLRGSVFGGDFDGWFGKQGKGMGALFRLRPRQQEEMTLEELEEQTPKELTPDKREKLEEQVYKFLWRDSKVVSILLNVYGRLKHIDNVDDCWLNSQNETCITPSAAAAKKKRNHSPLRVECGVQPENSTTNCQPLENACLFDIEKDPCEYNNIASWNRQIVEDLKKELDAYRSEMVAIRNKPDDEMAHPMYRAFTWGSWKETEDE